MNNMKVYTASPNYCMICRFNACHDELPVCAECLPEFQALLAEKCVKCRKSAFSCECYGDKAPRFVFFYGGNIARTLIYSLKEDADKRTVRFIAELMVRVSGIKPESFGGVTYVPRLKRKVRRAGYDQARILAEAISDIYGIPLITALERIPGTKDQKLLSKSDRIKQAQFNFRPAEPIPDEKYKRLLLIDDVSTTGATIHACEKLLRNNFAESVVSLVISKTPYIK